MERAPLLALGRNLSPAATGARDLLDTAEIVATLAAVVTVDTSVAHLAASMGKPTFILVPALAPYWPWRHSGERSEWYPSACLFRQSTAWSDAIDQIEAALNSL